jgi:hypothetical protein
MGVKARPLLIDAAGLVLALREGLFPPHRRRGRRALTPRGIIVNEVVTNSKESTFEGRDEGLVAIALRKNGGTMIVDGSRGMRIHIEFDP